MCTRGTIHTHTERVSLSFLVDTRQREHVNALLRPPGGLLPPGGLPRGGLLLPHGRPRFPLGVCVALLPLGAELADELRGADGGPVGARVPRAGAPLQRARGVHADVPLSTHVRAGAVPGSRAVRPAGVASSSSRPESRPAPLPSPPPARPPRSCSFAGTTRTRPFGGATRGAPLSTLWTSIWAALRGSPSGAGTGLS